MEGLGTLISFKHWFLAFCWAGLLILVSLPPTKAQESYPVMELGHPELQFKAGVLLFRGNPFSGELREFYPSGTLTRRTGFEMGLKDGLELSWYESGDLAEVRDYKAGSKVGDQRAWYEEGQRSFQASFKNGVYHGPVQSWYKNGQLASVFIYKNGYEFGLQQAWRENGAIYANYEFVDGRRYGLYNPGLCFPLDKNEKTK